MKILFYISISILTIACSQRNNQSETTTTIESLNDIAIGQDATPVVISELRKTTHNTVIHIPQGNYTFYPDYASEKHFIISNNDNGFYRVLFDLKGKKNITIDGNGSLLTFNGHMIPFNLEDSENITLRNFSIDWERTFHSEATVVAVDKANKTFDIAISDQFPYRMEGDQLIFDQAIITFEPIILNPELSEIPFHRNVVIENNLIETFDNPVLDIFSVSNLSFTNNTIRRTNTFEPLFPEKPAINIRHSKDIVISDNIFEREGTDELHTDEQSASSLMKMNNDNLIIKKIIMDYNTIL